jgi:hypothetical protein
MVCIYPLMIHYAGMHDCFDIPRSLGFPSGGFYFDARYWIFISESVLFCNKTLNKSGSLFR